MPWKTRSRSASAADRSPCTWNPRDSALRGRECHPTLRRLVARRVMATRTARSLRHEYAAFIQQEIENYKESIPRRAILAIGDAVVRAMSDPGEATGNVLVSGEVMGRSALFFAASGCDVTSLGAEESDVQRVMDAAIRAGLAARVHAVATELADFTPDAPLHARSEERRVGKECRSRW